jgi:hypothetical protein
MVEMESVVGPDECLRELRDKQQMPALFVRRIELGDQFVGKLLHTVLVRGQYPIESRHHHLPRCCLPDSIGWDAIGGEYPPF